MQQIQFEYKDNETLGQELKKIRLRISSCETRKVLFHIYTTTVNERLIEGIQDIILKEIPEALLTGSSSNGNIVDGNFAQTETIIVCTLFESKTTQIKILNYPLSSENSSSVAQEIIDEINGSPWVKAMEMLVTIRGMSMTNFCDALQGVREGVQIFGGGAFNQDINDDTACVFTNNFYTHHGAVLILYGGDDLDIYTMHVTGWKPLGRAFQVTKAKSNILYELDNRPAYEAYYRYLNIKNDRDFFNNTLEFPFFYQLNGINILRAPIASNPDGSLTMTSDMAEHVTARIAYGDPKTILKSVRHEGQKIREFRPQAIQIFSCAARRTFWGEDELSKETHPFESMAPTFGFYTSGEFLRTGKHVNQHNVTLVVAAMREGKPQGRCGKDFRMSEENFSGKVSMINRLATFIEAATAELNTANKLLKTMAQSDNLTLLFSRSEIQNRILSEIKINSNFSLILFDLDHMKKINVDFGCQEGDNVIREISNQIQYCIAAKAFSGSAGRWDGNEFMVLLPHYDDVQAFEFAETVKSRFEKKTFAKAGSVSVSAAITQVTPADTLDSLCARLESAMNKAKSNGKSQIVKA